MNDNSPDINISFAKQETLLIPIKNSARQRKVSDQEDFKGYGGTPNNKKTSSFELTGKTTPGSRKSSFSKKSNSRMGSRICCDDSSDNFALAAASVGEYEIKETFVTKFKDDFDRLKYYEDTAIKIYNEISLSKTTHPSDALLFQDIYKNTTSHN